ncbi:hypothetical protein NEF87_001866 [Candidatus Lokiarchaeum ossiferum]|uniref:Uncharacterized protein n=1 Tax=Candidatus Lokiarchaeum ossiferum TaxID=2951803 RepID=A0ABY6HPZ2_9ARCH|nr:hypothetical protein NEF87_001866 [Candidatus Lokiarchaeum sp. B-35]
MRFLTLLLKKKTNAAMCAFIFLVFPLNILEIIPISADMGQNDEFSSLVPIKNVPKSATDLNSMIIKFGGDGTDRAYGATKDIFNNTYICGLTTSVNFTVTANASQVNYGGGDWDGFVMKISSQNQLLYSSYFGGNRLDNLGDVYFNSYNELLIVGSSTSSDIPYLDSSFPEKTANENNFVLVMDFETMQISNISFFGGSGFDNVHRSTMDSNGNIILIGDTDSKDLPTSKDSIQQELKGENDLFICNYSRLSHSFEYITYFGGSDTEAEPAIAVNADGLIGIIGYTRSTDVNLTSNAYQTHLGGGNDVLISVLNVSARKVEFCTYFGGNGGDFGYGIAFSKDNELVVSGNTYSSNFPTMNAQDSTNNGEFDVFLSIFSANLYGLKYSSYYGGNGEDQISGLKITKDNLVIIYGSTASEDFPTTESAIQSTLNGENDGFIAIVNLNGMIEFSTFFGGINQDNFWNLCICSESNEIILPGSSNSLDFPRLNEVSSLEEGQEIDGFVCIFSIDALIGGAIEKIGSSSVSSFPLISIMVGALFMTILLLKKNSKIRA